MKLNNLFRIIGNVSFDFDFIFMSYSLLTITSILRCLWFFGIKVFWLSSLLLVFGAFVYTVCVFACPDDIIVNILN